MPPTARPASVVARTTIHHGAAVLGLGSAIVTAERDAADSLHAVNIERLPADISVVTRRLRELEAEYPGACIHVGRMGSGGALWDTLRVQGGRRRWQLFDNGGVHRQALVDGLLNAEAEGRFTFDPTLHDAPVMKKALAALTCEVHVDGVGGGERLVALALVVLGRRPPQAKAL